MKFYLIGLCALIALTASTSAQRWEEDDLDDSRDEWDRFEPQDRVSRLRSLIDRLEARSSGVFLPTLRRAIRHRIQNLKALLNATLRSTTRDGVGSGLFRDTRSIDDDLEENDDFDDNFDDWDRFEPTERASRLRSAINRLEARRRLVFLPTLRRAIGHRIQNLRALLGTLGRPRFVREANETKSGDDEPNFIQRRIKRIQDSIQSLLNRAKKVRDGERTLLFKRIDALRALQDRLLKREDRGKPVSKRQASSDDLDQTTASPSELSTRAPRAKLPKEFVKKTLKKFREQKDKLMKKLEKAKGERRQRIFQQLDTIRAGIDQLIGKE